MKNVSVIQTRVDGEVRKSAEDVLKKMGLSMNDAIRIFLNQIVADKGLPFRPRLREEEPNADTLAALKEAVAGQHSRRFSSVDELLAGLED